jgi:hypothetical protein
MADEFYVSPKEYIDLRFDNAEKYNKLQSELIDLRFRLMQLAVDKAEAGIGRRFDAGNEWRGAMDDRERAYVRTETHEGLASKVQRLDDKDAKSEGKAAGLSQLGTIVVASIATAAATATLVLGVMAMMAG